MKNFKMKRPFTPEFDKKVIDCIKSQELSLWKPAYKKGKPVSSEITMPVRLEKFG